MAEGVTTIEIGAGESISASTMNSVAPLDSSSSVVQLDPAQPLVLNPTPTPVVAAPVPIKYKTSTAAATAAKREKRLERERLQGIASISLNNANALALAIEREANAAPGNPYENPETLVAKASTGSANWNALLKRARTQRIPSWDWGTAQYHVDQGSAQYYSGVPRLYSQRETRAHVQTYVQQTDSPYAESPTLGGNETMYDSGRPKRVKR